MLGFFRKYQRLFFIVITVVIIASFSFFGTFGTFGNPAQRDNEAFVAVNGRSIPQSQLQFMVYFLNTDSWDSQMSGRLNGGNILNDGIFMKDFVESGLAEMLLTTYREQLAEDFTARVTREKNFRPYQHATADFIGAETIWSYLIPDRLQKLQALKNVQDPLSAEGLRARVALYLSEKQFPGQLLAQVIRNQETQFDWIEPDESLMHKDLATFGYHTLEDWFGPTFVKLAAEFLFNTAYLAEERGFSVSDAEALAEIYRKSEESFRRTHAEQLGFANSREYLAEYLRHTGIDLNSAIKAMRRVLLFRRLYDSASHSVLVDAQTQTHLNKFANEVAKVELYSLPHEMHLPDFRALQKYETYLDATTERATTKGELLQVPLKVKTVQEIEQTTPQLVQRNYKLHITHVSAAGLQAHVPEREVLAWQLNSNNWEKLKRQFPELAASKASNDEERFLALEALEPSLRDQLDRFTRKTLVTDHPEWLEAAFASTLGQEQTVGLRAKGGKLPLTGNVDRRQLIKLLDTADSPESKAQLERFSADNENIYRIQLISRAPEPQLLTFEEASRDGTLDKLLEAQLENSYQQLRKQEPAKYSLGNGKWKPLSEVRDAVALVHFNKILQAIHDSCSGLPDLPKTLDPTFCAHHRFYASAKQALEKLHQQTIPAAPWKKETLSLHRGELTGRNAEQLFTLTPGSLTGVIVSKDGAISFAQILERSEEARDVALDMRKAQELLGIDAKQALTEKLLAEMQSRNAIRLGKAHAEVL